MRAVLPPITWCSARGGRAVNGQSAPTIPASGKRGELAPQPVQGSSVLGAPSARSGFLSGDAPVLDTANQLGEPRPSPSHRA